MKRKMGNAIGSTAVVILAAAVAASCSDMATQPAEEALHHHRTGHAGGGSGGGGNGDGSVGYEVRVIDEGTNYPGHSHARAVDSHGTVVGDGGTPEQEQRPLYWRAGDADLLAVPGLAELAGSGHASAIHDGWIVGSLRSDDRHTAFLVGIEGQTPTILEPLDLEPLHNGDCAHDSAEAKAVAEWGATGTSSCGGEHLRGVVWRHHDDLTATELPLAPGDEFRDVRDASDTGTVLGTVWRHGQSTIVTWQIENGGLSDPSARPSGSLATALAINNDGDIVGPAGVRSQLVTSGGESIDLERLHQRDGSVIASALTDRDDEGRVRVVGRSGDRPVLWTVDTGNGAVSAIVMDVPGGYARAEARAINAAGLIAGVSVTSARGNHSSAMHATIWSPKEGSH